MTQHCSCWPWPWSPGSGGVCQILHCIVTPFPSHNVFDERGHYEQLTLNEWEVMLQLLKGEEPHKLLGILLHGDICLFCSFMYLFNRLFISVWTHYMYVLLWVLQYHFTLLLKSFQFWPLGTPSMGSWFSITNFFLSTSLFSEAIRCSRLFLSISCPSPRTNHFFKESGNFLLENSIRNQDVGLKGPCNNQLLQCHF